MRVNFEEDKCFSVVYEEKKHKRKSLICVLKMVEQYVMKNNSTDMYARFLIGKHYDWKLKKSIEVINVYMGKGIDY